MATRKKILVFGYLPPPYIGPSVAYQALMRSGFPRHFAVSFIKLNVVADVSELEIFRVHKLLKLLQFVATECWYLLTRRFDFCCYPISFNRNAFLKDALLLGVARTFGVPTVLWAHANNLPDFYTRSPRWVQRIIDRTVSKSVAAIVLGERLRFNFQRHLPDDRIFVVPLGVEPVAALPQSAKRPGVLTVLYLGTLIREKGVVVLIQAIQEVVKKFNCVRFVFAGDWQRANLRLETERMIQQSGIEAYVEFVGPVWGKAKWRVLSDADVLALPTFYYYEAHPNVLLEAMQAGLPIVTTRRGAIPEIVEDGVNGLLVEEQDPRDLAEKILLLATNPSLRQQIGRANREKFERCYTHEQYGRRMIEAFEAIQRLE